MTKKQKILLERHLFLIEVKKNKKIWSEFFKICKNNIAKPSPN